MASVGVGEILNLEPAAIIGFDGHVIAGLRIHPDGRHLIFPLGNEISIYELETNRQTFLRGHTNTISTVDISPSGKMVASGQTNHMGFRAYVIIWDWQSRQEISRYELHRVKVQSLCFTCNEQYLVSLGGKDCGSIIVWDIEQNMAICGTIATKETTGDATKVCALNKRWTTFVSGGDQNLRVWNIDPEKKRLNVLDVAVGKLRREFTGMRITDNDDILYVGTMSGDVVKIGLNVSCSPMQDKIPILLGCFGKHNARKPVGKDCEKYHYGVRDLLILRDGKLIIGAGDGTIDMVQERNVNFKNYNSPTWPQLTSLQSTKVGGVITSLQIVNNCTLLIGTNGCEIYSLELNNLCSSLRLLKTCHTNAVYDIAFPYNFSLVFATSSHESIRIWSTSRMQELLRIVVPNFASSSIVFARDGKSIISAWNDGVIRAFTPLTGKLIYAIPNAHNKGCSSLAVTSNGKILVSGGIEGQVRVWKIEPFVQSMIGVLKEHYGPIESVHINNFDTEVVSASRDGSCVIWDLIRLTRKHVIFAHTQFIAAQYYPTGVQILTAGSDKLIGYWEAFDGSLVREVEGSKSGPINAIDMNMTGEHFVSAGTDQIVRLWDYQLGEEVAVGIGHASAITSARYSPNGKFLVTGSTDGGIFVWTVPEQYQIKMSPTGQCMDVTDSITKKQLRAKKSNENVRQLESARSDRSSQIAKCPDVDLTAQPTIDPCVDTASLVDDNEHQELLETRSVHSQKSQIF
ncbi:cilia- and flagella-associated protein 52-like [Topomyia yanbarensis]|uniref:cilia- and flagella-associated protein 52-like n=1 Tax=Topomyia yanbarensis TaxID=2498891 RepID=UPI00273C4F9C|nr:cilia- and flagella-associated protein 52-like [Topomyia yanbarensis]XP_058838276.1 cilia- and flagella-associated protein 52-like [Topomyia yanbarensis]